MLYIRAVLLLLPLRGLLGVSGDSEEIRSNCNKAVLSPCKAPLKYSQDDCKVVSLQPRAECTPLSRDSIILSPSFLAPPFSSLHSLRLASLLIAVHYHVALCLSYNSRVYCTVKTGRIFGTFIYKCIRHSCHSSTRRLHDRSEAQDPEVHFAALFGNFAPGFGGCLRLKSSTISCTALRGHV